MSQARVLLRCKDGFEVTVYPDPPTSVGHFPIFDKQYFVPLYELNDLKREVAELKQKLAVAVEALDWCANAQLLEPANYRAREALKKIRGE